jgi:hypothetical protein
MKFFTSKWWESGCADTSVIEKYQAHYNSIENNLPYNIREFETEHTIHDANVKGIESDFEKRNVQISLLGWDNEAENRILFDLTFYGVSSFLQLLPFENRFEIEFGDLGYWEYDVVKDGIEMRMLFVSRAEFKIVFREFEFKCTPTSS